jgi:hypothetical protein
MEVQIEKSEIFKITVVFGEYMANFPCQNYTHLIQPYRHRLFSQQGDKIDNITKKNKNPKRRGLRAY